MKPVLRLVGLLVAAALLALASGADAWACVTALAGSWFGLLVLFGWTWALAYHWLNGIRHLLQDVVVQVASQRGALGLVLFDVRLEKQTELLGAARMSQCDGRLIG